MLFIVNDKAENEKNSKEVEYINTICNLKRPKFKNNILLLDNVTINNDGFLVERSFFLDELFILIPFIVIITTKNSDKLQEIATFHKVKLVVLDKK